MSTRVGGGEGGVLTAFLLASVQFLSPVFQQCYHSTSTTPHSSLLPNLAQSSPCPKSLHTATPCSWTCDLGSGTLACTSVRFLPSCHLGWPMDLAFPSRSPAGLPGAPRPLSGHVPSTLTPDSSHTGLNNTAEGAEVLWGGIWL